VIKQLVVIMAVFASGLPAKAKTWKANYPVPGGTFKSNGSGDYFILEPGFRLDYAAKGGKVLVVEVLDETKLVDGVQTRVVTESENENGVTTEISRNYFAVSEKTGDLCYFGEDVDNYKGGKVANHDGSWLSGKDGAHFGVMLPAHPARGQKFAEEQAPGKAMDRAEVITIDAAFKAPAGNFKACLVTEETSPLEAGAPRKTYARGVGLVQDDELLLTKISRQKGKR